MPMTDLKKRRFAKIRKIFLIYFLFYREKTRSLLVNVFRTRRSNVGLSSNEV
jgi:hypothetical protein